MIKISEKICENTSITDEFSKKTKQNVNLILKVSYLGVNLLADLLLDLTGITGKERQESLGAGVDNIDFMKSYGVHNLLALLKLTLGALHKSHLRSHSIIVSGVGERSAEQ